ncbi:hypothetical protein BGZ83_011379 [Gryganskiella cystojenkinii]|nr:hypothetical protein BGZ83_011379 [Gryganskiella cystojenkinii]
MRLSIAALAMVVVSTLGVVSAQYKEPPHYGICTCFQPKYDASCCMYAKGYMMNDGNVCSTPDNKGALDKFEACCIKSGGRHKCKYGDKLPGSWPPEDTYSCKA